jgi:hypothetical protein
MIKLFEKSHALIKIWLVIGMTVLFIITLPVFIVVLPFAAAYQLVEHIYKTQPKNDRLKKLDIDFGADIFDIWFGTNGFNNNKEGK